MDSMPKLFPNKYQNTPLSRALDIYDKSLLVTDEPSYNTVFDIQLTLIISKHEKLKFFTFQLALSQNRKIYSSLRFNSCYLKLLISQGVLFYVVLFPTRCLG